VTIIFASSSLYKGIIGTFKKGSALPTKITPIKMDAGP
jgi:hypothetical protein